MTRRHTADIDTSTTSRPITPAGLRAHGSAPTGLINHRYVPRTRADVEERYVAARDAWTAAMKAANSGKAADLAALALAQETYEAAVAERKRWDSGGRVAIAIEPDPSPHPDLGAVIGQELAWRRVRSVAEQPLGFLGRLRRRLRRG